MNDDTGGTSRSAFQELRQIEHRGVPALDHVIGAGRARQSRRKSGVRKISWGALTGLAAAAAVLSLCVARPAVEPVPIEQISAWSPATDALLPDSLPALFRDMPPLGASVVDALIQP
jgi:hypothetical protein